MKLGLYGLGLVLAATSLAPVCAGQIASYSITPDLTSLPAGSNGASLRATVENLSQGSSFNVCFYTGFGDMAPIVPDSLLYLGNSASVSFHVDPSSIQDVPPASFTGGVFPALLYIVDPSATSCTGVSQTQGNAATISLRFPSLTSLSLTSTPHLNPKLTSLLPSNLALTGMDFLGGHSTQLRELQLFDFCIGQGQLHLFNHARKHHPHHASSRCKFGPASRSAIPLFIATAAEQ